MTTSVEKNATGYVVKVDGVIKSVSDSQSIKDAITSCSDTSLPITLLIENSFSVTSSVIGFLLKKIQGDKVNMSVRVGDDRLLDLFKSLNLVDVLRVSKA